MRSNTGNAVIPIARHTLHMNRRTLIGRGLSAASLGIVGGVLMGCNTVHSSRSLNTATSQSKRVVVVGAGIAGLAAASELRAKGYDDVIVLEARDRIGGRIWTASIGGYPIDLGASWIHGVDGNPINSIAAENGIQTIPTDYDNKTILTQHCGTRFRTSSRILKSFWKFARQRPRDSLRNLYERYISESDPTDEERRYLAYVLNTSIEHEFGANIDDLSIVSIYGGEDFPGDDVLFPGGYDQIVNVLAADLDIRTGHAISMIDYRDADVVLTTTAGEKLEADSVVVTVPLGVLKKGSIKFMPELPQTAQQALDGLGVGVLNKTCLLFDDIFWPPEIELIGYISDHPGLWAETINQHPYTHRPILMMFNAGGYGIRIETMSDAEILGEALDTLSRMFGKVPAPKEALITRWNSDPWSHGSYSYVPVDSSFERYADLAKPIEDRLFFAGEATHEEYPATVHGAYLSGVRAATHIVANDIMRMRRR